MTTRKKPDADWVFALKVCQFRHDLRTHRLRACLRCKRIVRVLRRARKQEASWWNDQVSRFIVNDDPGKQRILEEMVDRLRRKP